MAKPWGGAGAWAAEAEQAEAEAKAKGAALPPEQYPSLEASIAAKPKKKKAQTLSFSEFATGVYVGPGGRTRQMSDSQRLTTEEMMLLPTAPRERTDEEIGGLGGRGFRDYGARSGGGMGFGDRSGSDREPRERGFGGGFDRGDREDRRGMGPTRDDGPSRADEAENWGASKKTTLSSYVGGGGGGDRRGGGYDDHDRTERRMSDRDLPSRADEVDNWGQNKKFVPGPVDGYGERRVGRGVGFDDRRGGGGFDDAHGGISRADEVSNWGAAKKSVPTPAPPERRGGGGFESYSRDTGPDSDRWGRRTDIPPREEIVRPAERPRLVLQPRTIPIEQPTLPVPLHVDRNGENERPLSSHSTRSDRSVALSENSLMSDTSAPRKPRSNPFGSARPREEVLAEKGQDWRKIDAELDLKTEKFSRPSSSHSSRSSRPQTPEVGVGEGLHKPRPRVSPFGEARPRERDIHYEDRRNRDWRKFDVDLHDRPGREQIKPPPEENNVQTVS